MNGRDEDSYFRDWESHVFGFGYGTGEPHILPALKRFFELCRADDGYPRYNYEELESELTAPVAWLLINALCHSGMIDYGSSPRYAWLSGTGKRLQSFLGAKTHDELVELVCDRKAGEEFYCTPTCFNCGPNGYEKGRVCSNPFYGSRR